MGKNKTAALHDGDTNQKSLGQEGWNAVPEQTTPKFGNLEDTLTCLHAQLYVMRSQVAAWQSSSAPSTPTNHPDAKTGQALSLMEECCWMDWEIGQSLLNILHSVQGKCEQPNSSSADPMGTGLPILSNSLPKAKLVRHPSSILAAVSTSLAAN
jgi:hypothetical protein